MKKAIKKVKTEKREQLEEITLSEAMRRYDREHYYNQEEPDELATLRARRTQRKNNTTGSDAGLVDSSA